MILVTGATGTTGGAVLRELIERGVKGVRAMCRGDTDRARLPAGAEAVVADFANPQSLADALEGVQAAFLVCAPVPELVQLETNFLLACRERHIGHVVVNSALGAEDFPKTFPSWHRKVEDKAREIGVPCTILRPNGHMQNIASYFAPTIRSQDAFYGTIGNAAISLIDVRDVAAAAATTLMRNDTIGQVFELSGPEAVSYPALAARLSTVAGRTIRYVDLSPEQMLQGMIASGMPAPQATAVLELDDYYRSGKGAAPDTALRQLLDRAPRTLDAYLAEIAPLLAKPQDAPAGPSIAPVDSGSPVGPGFTAEEAKAFVRDHFEQFVNRGNVAIGEVNFTPDFVDHGADVPAGLPPGRAGAMQYVGAALKRIPDLHVTIEDIIAEGDRVVVRNVWKGTDSVQGKRITFGGIVIWRIAGRQLAERWAYLEPPRSEPAR